MGIRQEISISGDVPGHESTTVCCSDFVENQRSHRGSAIADQVRARRLFGDDLGRYFRVALFHRVVCIAVDLVRLDRRAPQEIGHQ